MNSGNTEAKTDGQVQQEEGPSHWEEPVVSPTKHLGLLPFCPKSFSCSQDLQIFGCGGYAPRSCFRRRFTKYLSHWLACDKQRQPLSPFFFPLPSSPQFFSFSQALPFFLFVVSPLLQPPTWNSAGNQMKEEAKPVLPSDWWASFRAHSLWFPWPRTRLVLFPDTTRYPALKSLPDYILHITPSQWFSTFLTL